MKLILLIPAFNEQSTLGAVLRSLPKKLSGITRIQTLVVDDGSTDKTVSIAKKYKARVLSLPRNSGVGRAIQVGLEAALQQDADFVVTLDADGQFPASAIPNLLQPLLQKKADFSTGSRFLNPSWTPPMSWSKLSGNRFLAWGLSHVLQTRLTDVSCGFRAYNREALLKLQLFGKFTYTQETFLQLAKQHLEFIEVPVRVLPTQRPGGKSHIAESVLAYGWKAGVILLRSVRDYRPFLFFGVPAAVAFALGVGAGVVVLAHYLIFGSFTPFKALGFFGLFSILGGIVLGVFALQADMLDRVRQQQDKILYYLRKQEYEK